MGRATTIADEDILDAARAVFLERGMRATTAEVARQAGVSEGSIFKRFPSKAALFKAAMTPGPGIPEFVTYLSENIENADLEAALFRTAQLALDFFRRVLPLAMMAWSNPGWDEQRSEAGQGAAIGIRTVSSIFERAIEVGRLRAVDPQYIARTFMGSIANLAVTEMMAGGQMAGSKPDDELLRGLVDIVLYGAMSTEG